MTNAFGIEHSPIVKVDLPPGFPKNIERVGIKAAYKAGRQARAAIDAKQADMGASEFRAAKKEAGAFGNAAEGPSPSFAERAAQHVGFHRNAYMVGAGATKEGIAVGAGISAYNQRKKRKAMEAAGYQPPPDTSMAPVVGALTKGMDMISAFGIEHGPISKADQPAPPNAQPRRASGGRVATTYFLPGIHGAVAAKPGRKLRQTGSEVGHVAGGGILGGIAGSVPGAIMHNPKVAEAGSALGQIGGGIYGAKRSADIGTARGRFPAQRPQS